MSEGGNSGDFFKSGDWNAACDICGFRFKASKLKKNWKNEMVCEADFELRHPQEFIRVRPEKISVPWARPESDIATGPACFVWSQSAYAGLAEAGCMQAGNGTQSSVTLWFLKWPFDVPSSFTQTQYSGIPGYAIPGLGIPGVTFTGL